MILLIDNYDSFTWNLVQYLRQLGQEVRVVRNDEIEASAIEAIAPAAIVLSPGPCTPDEAGICLEVVKQYQGRIPIFGVCLGLQCIAQALGGKVTRANTVMHGKTSVIEHSNSGAFQDLQPSLKATRYHSLIAERASLPEQLTITAWCDDGTVMGVRSAELSLEAVQFHPESLFSDQGHRLLANFLQQHGIAVDQQLLQIAEDANKANTPCPDLSK